MHREFPELMPLEPSSLLSCFPVKTPNYFPACGIVPCFVWVFESGFPPCCEDAFYETIPSHCVRGAASEHVAKSWFKFGTRRAWAEAVDCKWRDSGER